MNAKSRMAVGIGSLVSLASGSALYGAMKFFDYQLGSMRSEVGALEVALSAYRADLDRIELWDTLRNSAERSGVADKIVDAMVQVDIYNVDIGELKHQADQLVGSFVGTVAVGSALAGVYIHSYLKSGGIWRVKRNLRRAYDSLTA